MQISSAISLFTVMFVLAALPSSSVLIVITRSATFGLAHGVMAALGIVTGDILFILIAVLGLTFLTDSLGEFFILVKYIGGAYLFWLAITMWRSAPADKYLAAVQPAAAEASSLLSSYLSGLLFTLADQKAVLFYLGLFPAFVNLSIITAFDIAIIILITIMAVGGVKVAYAIIADRAVVLLGARLQRTMKKVAAAMVMTIAAYIVFSA